MAYTYGGGPGDPPVLHGQRDEHVEEEVAFALSWTGYAAQVHTGLAYATMARLPAVHAALRAGQIDLPKAKVLLEEVELLDDDQARAVIARVLPDAAGETTGTLRHTLRRLVLTIDPDAVHKRHRKALEERDVRCIRHRDGTASIVGRHLPADKAAAAMDHLGRVATATRAAGDPLGTTFDRRDARTTSQIRADVFVDLLAGADPTVPAARGGAGAVNPAPRKGVVNVTVDLTTLMCLTEHPGELAGFGPVVADIARSPMTCATSRCGGSVSPTTVGCCMRGGFTTGPPRSRAYVQARDGHCQAPGCRRPPHQCDIDHITAREHHGPTIEDNLCVVCRRHHRAKHGGFRLYRTDSGLVWISPRGRAYPVSFGKELDQTQRRILQRLINEGEEANLRH